MSVHRQEEVFLEREQSLRRCVTKKAAPEARDARVT
jgi:hypothetical protein